MDEPDAWVIPDVSSSFVANSVVCKATYERGHKLILCILRRSLSNQPEADIQF